MVRQSTQMESDSTSVPLWTSESASSSTLIERQICRYNSVHQCLRLPRHFQLGENRKNPCDRKIWLCFIDSCVQAKCRRARDYIGIAPRHVHPLLPLSVSFVDALDIPRPLKPVIVKMVHQGLNLEIISSKVFPAGK